ncbi:SDR family NAD(P)-dependent oxidoreductase [Crossiella sp. CA-258035]|uniref:SDR family NAD(P)-dependent oxidoreductase n=1 Tax=Crossiella sp. CA-258035 TaxID=2981138 RepID=UPI0024BC2B71|nr:SDR family NAD(P)-dependent oxidoreductase [Crossiella sp. CA-258035]WHT22596.1 SDR family NAD(P)-dependent oxidoreductase [Crossiella sp. CA-258035]
MSDSPIMLVTGGSDGIGFETAHRLLAAGATVILHARTAELAELATERLVEAGAEPLRLHQAVADFTRLGEVTEMAAQLLARYPRLDALVNNAATAGPPHRLLTEDGHEVTFQVNYLAAYLLTRSLEPLLAKASRGRVVNLSSSLHRGGNLNFADLDRARRYTRGAVYAQSKLALTVFTTALTEAGRPAVSVHPGIINTSLLKHYSYRGRPAADGAEPVAHLASPHTAVLDGGYYEGRVPAKPAPVVGDRRAALRLWKVSARLTGVSA